MAREGHAGRDGGREGRGACVRHDEDGSASASVRWETLTLPGSGEGRINEDHALVDQQARCAVLIDGATGLTKANLVPGESDAAWYARTLCEELAERLADPAASTTDALVEAGLAVARSYRRLPGAASLERIDEPNGSVAILRWQADEVEVSLLGDCTAVVALRDGSCEVMCDDTLTRLDDQNYERMFAYATKHGTTMAHARRALNPYFIENRLKMNEPGGYWAADISCRGMTHALTRTFPLDQVESLFACSDGYASAVTMGVCEGLGELSRRVAAGEGRLVGEELRAAEREDALCWRVHRSKTSDDATYVCVWLREDDGDIGGREVRKRRIRIRSSQARAV